MKDLLKKKSAKTNGYYKPVAAFIEEDIRKRPLYEKELNIEASGLPLFLRELAKNTRTSPHCLSNEALKMLLIKMNTVHLFYRDLTQTLKQFYSLHVADAEKIFWQFANKIPDSSSGNRFTESTNIQHVNEVRFLNNLTMKHYYMPFHLAALHGLIGPEQLQDVAPRPEAGISMECRQMSFPETFSYGFSFRLTSPSGIHHIERVEGGGCQYGLLFNRQIKGWNTALPRAVAMISAHGLEGRLHASKNALFINASIARLFGFAPDALMDCIRAVKK